MIAWKRLRRAAVVMGATAALTSAPASLEAQACSAGPLSAYLASAGLGCTFGQLRMKQFSSSAFVPFADQVFINPFTLQGPPGYTWVGFSVRFGAGLSFGREAPLDFSFWSENAPLHGLLAQNNLIGTPTHAGSLRGRLTSDAGFYRATDRINRSLGRDLTACSKMGSASPTCQTGTSTWVGQLADGDNAYLVDATSFVAGSGAPYDYTIAVLTDQATVAPEPATLLLLSSGLGGVGAIVRRRRRGVLRG